MDCCDNRTSRDKEDNGEESETREKNWIWLVIGVIFGVIVFFAFLLGSSSAEVSDSGLSGKIDTTGWTTNEIMNYEMHGTIPARAGKISTTASSGGMVGGC